jgi:hypothetical protein
MNRFGEGMMPGQYGRSRKGDRDDYFASSGGGGGSFGGRGGGDSSGDGRQGRKGGRRPYPKICVNCGEEHILYSVIVRRMMKGI